MQYKLVELNTPVFGIQSYLTRAWYYELRKAVTWSGGPHLRNG
jgi:hypothetical protein